MLPSTKHQLETKFQLGTGRPPLPSPQKAFPFRRLSPRLLCLRERGESRAVEFAMLRGFFFAATLASAMPAMAQRSTSTVELSNFKFAPSQIRLQAKTPTILLLKNNSSETHSFSAPEFFGAAQVDPASAGLIRDGRIEVPAHATAQVTLTPRAGQYSIKCTRPLHSTLGMKGVIFVR